jgi:hypothetical protein
MKLNLETELRTMDGNPLYENVITDGITVKKNITVAVVLRAALTQTLQDDTRKDKEIDFTIMTKIITCKGNSIELESEDIIRLKTKIYKLYDAWVSGCMELILEGKKLPI